MDGNLSTVVQTARQLALLAATLERRSETAVSAQESAARALTRTAATAKADIEGVMRSAGSEIEQATSAAVGRALTNSANVFSRWVADGTERLEEAARVVDVSAQLARTGMVRQIRTAYLAVAGAIGLLGLGGGLLIWAEVVAYKSASARAMAARIDADVTEAYARARMTSCGGHPCVKLDKKLPRWGNNGQYVLLDLTGSHH